MTFALLHSKYLEWRENEDESSIGNDDGLNAATYELCQ
jgi:hypothetical protein